MTPVDDLAAMLRDLGDRGWKPVLFPQDDVWVCYPDAAVRTWASFRQPDPVSAVRGLYEHALRFPNEPPVFASIPTSDLDQRYSTERCAMECMSYRVFRRCACIDAGRRPAPSASAIFGTPGPARPRASDGVEIDHA